MDKSLFGCKFMTMDVEHTNENKGHLQSGNLF
jgi:hypothetical protein